MNDEIKEILESSRKIINSNRENGFDRIIMLGDDIDKLLDYITNLQTIEQQYSAILSENVELENKITNLQEEINKLTAESTEWESKFYDMQDNFHNANEEIERLKIQLNNADNKNLELIEELNKEIDRYEDTISFELGYDKGSKEYKSRIDKAIDIISKEFLCYDNESEEYIQGKKAINILNGGDE